MTKSSDNAISYDDKDRQVSWRGVSMKDGSEFENFIESSVKSRLYDIEGNTDFETHLVGLANTGFARESLKAIMEEETHEDRDWAIGEALAEAYLENEYGISWPWNMKRDMRNPRASLPGADLIGFRIDGEDVRLVLGEVKSSSDADTPPNVMYGQSGMIHQIDKLAKNLSLIYQLLKWLLPRCKGTKHETNFNKAIGLFLESGNKDIALIGVLVRDTQPNMLDLQAGGRTLAGTLQFPTTCHLIAIYLPCTIVDLISLVSGDGS